MAENTAIEWADHTFNPWIGCQVASPDGCKNCYAADWAKRYGRDFAARTRTSVANWKQPLKWNTQAQREGQRFRVFCASLADVFDNQVPVKWRRDLFDLIDATPSLDWLLLTKRIGNARSLYGEAYLDSARPWPKHVWLGATVVNQTEADRDIPKLLAVPAAKRFLSIEPMLGAIDFYQVSAAMPDRGHPWSNGPILQGVDWVICGGESGRAARPMHPDWARSLRDQCASAGVPFLFKQWGEWAPGSDRHWNGSAISWAGDVAKDSANGCDYPPDATAADRWAVVHRAGKKTAGRLLDGRTHDEFPEGGAA